MSSALWLGGKNGSKSKQAVFFGEGGVAAGLGSISMPANSVQH